MTVEVAIKASVVTRLVQQLSADVHSNIPDPQTGDTSLRPHHDEQDLDVPEQDGILHCHEQELSAAKPDDHINLEKSQKVNAIEANIPQHARKTPSSEPFGMFQGQSDIGQCLALTKSDRTSRVAGKIARAGRSSNEKIQQSPVDGPVPKHASPLSSEDIVLAKYLRRSSW